MFSIQISRIVSWDLHWNSGITSAVLLKQKEKDKMFYTIPNTLKHGFLSGEQFVQSSSSITKSIIFGESNGVTARTCTLHKHGTHTHTNANRHTDKQEHAGFGLRAHTPACEFKWCVILSHLQFPTGTQKQWGHQGTTDGEEDQKTVFVCVCLFTTQQSIWRSQRWSHRTLFSPPLLSQSLFLFQNPVKCLGSFIVLINVHCTTEIITVAQVAPVIFCLYIQHQHHGWY